MIRTILSLGSIVFIVAVVATGTVAFFSDTETSSNNAFTAGAIDLLIDNESYYNGNVCEDVGTSTPDWQWQGSASYPVPGTPCSTSFGLSNLDEGHLFFDFHDLKPDDEGEDTISIHVQNDAWICLDLTLTSNDDNSSNEPELQTGDDPEDEGNPFDGELADGIHFFWWADDGDNVYEEGEPPITDGVVSLSNLDANFPIALADSGNNIWGTPGPVPGDETVYIAKAWCLGDLALAAVPNNGGVNPSVDPGVACDGSLYGNEYQTDGATLDILFTAEQARHNESFLCEPPTDATLIVHKVVDNSAGGSAIASDFTLFIDGATTTNGIAMIVATGTYAVSETNLPDYEASFSGDCDAGGSVTVTAGQVASCTITNTYIQATSSLTVTKVVVGTTTPISNFELLVDATPVTSGVETIVAPGSYTVSEVDDFGLFTSVISGDCDPNGDITLVQDEVASCTITNTYAPADITIDKLITFSSETISMNIANFELFVDDGVNPQVQLTDEVTKNDLPAGTYTVSENYVGPHDISFDAQFSGDCSDDGQTGTIIVGPNGSADCQLINVVTVNNP